MKVSKKSKYQTHEKPKRRKKPNALKERSFRIFQHPLLRNIKKLKVEKNLVKKNSTPKKVSQCRKTERGTLRDFSTSILSQNIKKLKGDPLGKFFF